MPGIARRQGFEYRRNGTAVLFAGLNVHDGDVAGWVTDSTRSDNFVEFLGGLDAQTPSSMELHRIVDNFSAHFTPAVETFLDEHPRIFLHNTPTHVSWLNQVELFFSILKRRLLRNGISTASRISLFASSLSSTTTTVEPSPSVGPTTAVP